MRCINENSFTVKYIIEEPKSGIVSGIIAAYAYIGVTNKFKINIKTIKWMIDNVFSFFDFSNLNEISSSLKIYTQ